MWKFWKLHLLCFSLRFIPYQDADQYILCDDLTDEKDPFADSYMIKEEELHSEDTQIYIENDGDDDDVGKSINNGNGHLHNVSERNQITLR